MLVKRFILIGVFMCLFSSIVSGAVEVFPIEQVHPGLMGLGKTVVQGTTIEDFDVEVIGIIPQPSPTPALVMVRVSGDAIERSGGIASGMSGSPVYIDDQLLGAIGYGYEYSDHRVGLVTPAEQMLALMQSIPEDYAQPTIPQGFTELSNPIMISGIQGRAFDYLERSFEPYNMQVIPGLSGLFYDMESVELKPGSAIGVQLLRGDFQVVAFGTVTEVDEHGRFVGFGHSFLHKGDVNYFVAPATVHYTMPNIEFPFRIASAGNSAGVVLQDRAAGIAGVLTPENDYIPIEITVSDSERNLVDNYQVEAVRDGSLLSALAISSVYQGVDSTLDRIGAGTAYIRLEFVAKNLINPVVRENMFYSDSDIAVWSLSDLSEGIDIITDNTLQEVEIEKIKTHIVVENIRKTAEIEQAIPRSFQVEPGNNIEVEVRIRPYRQSVESRILSISIPEDTYPGLMTVSVRGGGMGYYSIKPTIHTTWQSLEEAESEQMWYEPAEAENLDILLAKYMNRERSNEIVAEFYPFIDEYSYDDAADDMPPNHHQPEGEPAGVELLEQDFGRYYSAGTDNEPVRVRLTTQYVIEGQASFEIEVL